MGDLNAAIEAATIERFNRRQTWIGVNQGAGATVWGQGIAEECIGPLAASISKGIAEVVQTHTNTSPLWELKGLSYVVRNLDPDVLAVATLHALLSSIALDADLRKTCENIGLAIRGECWSAGLLAHDARLHKRVEETVKGKHGNAAYRTQAARSILKRAGWRYPEWSPTDLHRCGNFFLNRCLDQFPHIFTVERSYNFVDQAAELYPNIKPDALPLAEAAIEEALQRNPVFLPCIQPPQPWTRFQRGGYWDERARFKASLVRLHQKDKVHALISAMKTGSVQPHVDAVNTLQGVAWQINKPVLQAVQWAYDSNIDVKGLPAKQDVPELPRLPEDVWEGDARLRKLHIHKLHQIHEHNRSLRSNRVLFAQDMGIAKQLAEADAFWTPLNCDWRGRVYSVPHFSFPRDDRVRALFNFREGREIGEEGLRWLKIHVANCGDFDKISKRPFEERVQWTNTNLQKIVAVATDPKAPPALAVWTQADKPFLFLAACLEVSAALSRSDPFAHVTQLPISFDGSCSGLQHLCAMTRAAEGSLVNLTPQAEPQDVYQTVADLVRQRIERDAASDAERRPDNGTGQVSTPCVTSVLAKLCLDHGISRKVVKRNVMTYSYSSKRYGMQMQQMEDLMDPLCIDVLAGKYEQHPFGEDEGYAAAKYLAGHVYSAIESVVHLPAQAMTFLQRCARALAHEGKPLQWTTPTGLPWSNDYHAPIVKRVRLWLGDAVTSIRVADGHKAPIDKDRASNGVAPNFVHSLDAAHLLLTTNACVRQGINSIATVHDSFGCLAPQATLFNRIIREEFVNMYQQHDVLAEVLGCAKRDLTVANWHRLPNVPDYGPLNLEDVINAQFAFA